MMLMKSRADDKDVMLGYISYRLSWK